MTSHDLYSEHNIVFNLGRTNQERLAFASSFCTFLDLLDGIRHGYEIAEIAEEIEHANYSDFLPRFGSDGLVDLSREIHLDMLQLAEAWDYASIFREVKSAERQVDTFGFDLEDLSDRIIDVVYELFEGSQTHADQDLCLKVMRQMLQCVLVNLGYEWDEDDYVETIDPPPSDLRVVRGYSFLSSPCSRSGNLSACTRLDQRIFEELAPAIEDGGAIKWTLSQSNPAGNLSQTVLGKVKKHSVTWTNA